MTHEFIFTFQGVFSDCHLKLIECFPPKNDSREPMKPIEFLDISVISDKEDNAKCKFSLVHCGWNSFESESRLKKEEKRLKSWEKTRLGVFVELRIEKGTLTYLINMHARLTILDFFSTLHALLYACTLNYFSIFFHPPH